MDSAKNDESVPTLSHLALSEDNEFGSVRAAAASGLIDLGQSASTSLPTRLPELPIFLSPLSNGLAQVGDQKVKMALIVDKHRPKSLDDLTYHDELSQRLRSLVCGPLQQPLQKNDGHPDRPYRPSAAISPTCWSTVLPVPARRLALSLH